MSKGSGQGLLGSRVEQIGLELAVSLGIFNFSMNTPKGVQYVMYEINGEHSSNGNYLNGRWEQYARGQYGLDPVDGGSQSVSKSTVATQSAFHRSCVLTVVEKVPPTHPLLFQAGKRLGSTTKDTDLVWNSKDHWTGCIRSGKISNGGMMEI